MDVKKTEYKNYIIIRLGKMGWCHVFNSNGRCIQQDVQSMDVAKDIVDNIN